MCYLNTLAQKFLFSHNTVSLENLVDNLWFSMPTFEYSFTEFRIYLSSLENHVKI